MNVGRVASGRSSVLAGDRVGTASRLRNLSLFLLLAVLFGGVFPAVKVGLRSVPPLTLAATRYALAAVLLLGYAVLTTDRWAPRTRGDRRAVVAAGTFFVGGTGLLFVGQQYTASGVAAIIFSLIPLLTAVLARFLLPTEGASRGTLAGILVGLVGVVAVVRPDPAHLLDGDAVGEGFVLLAAAGVALGTVLIRRSGPSMSVVALTGWAMAVGATLLTVAAVAVGEPVASVRPTPVALAVLVYLAVFAGAVGFVVYFALIERFGPLEVNLLAYLTPVVAIVIGRAFLGETIAPASLAGFGLIFVGFALVRRRELRALRARTRSPPRRGGRRPRTVP